MTAFAEKASHQPRAEMALSAALKSGAVACVPLPRAAGSGQAGAGAGFCC